MHVPSQVKYRQALRSRDCICYPHVMEDYNIDITYIIIRKIAERQNDGHLSW